MSIVLRPMNDAIFSRYKRDSVGGFAREIMKSRGLSEADPLEEASRSFEKNIGSGLSGGISRASVARTKVALHVFAANTSAKRLYELLGFRIDSYNMSLEI